jgi:HK97 family phage prohead protease
MKINVPIKITAADSESRTISGRIVTFGEVANTSVGRTIFAKGSIKPTNVKLNLEHDRTRPIGKTLSMNESEDGSGIDAVFKIANTSAGTDAIEEALAGLRDGFSVGVNVSEYDSEDGAMIIKSSDLIEVSLVTEPAVRSARVSDVAASEGEEEEEDDEDSEDDESEEETTYNEGEIKVENQTVEAPTVTETVEASQKIEASARPAFYTAPRLDLSPRNYLEQSVRAAIGDDEARAYVKAADTTVNNPAFNPTRQLTEVINPLGTLNRGVVDALSKSALPDAGMTFEIPKITQLPSVTEEAEGGTVADVNVNSAFVSVSVKKFSGAQTASLEIIDRSSPIFWDEVLRNLEFAYAKATDEYANDVLVTNGTASSTFANSSTGLLGFVSESASAIYKATKGFARNLIVSPDQWGNIMGYNDNGRPIYNAVAPMNAGGSVSPQSLTGVVAGMNLYVDAYKSGTDDNTMLIVNPDSYTWYESPRLRLQANITATGEISMIYYGYAALAVKVAGGCRKFNLT